MATLTDFTQMTFHEKLLVIEALGDDFSHAEGILETLERHQEVEKDSTRLWVGENATSIDWEEEDPQAPSADP